MSYSHACVYMHIILVLRVFTAWCFKLISCLVYWFIVTTSLRVTRGRVARQQLDAKLVSSKHFTQGHLQIPGRTFTPDDDGCYLNNFRSDISPKNIINGIIRLWNHEELHIDTCLVPRRLSLAAEVLGAQESKGSSRVSRAQKLPCWNLK